MKKIMAILVCFFMLVSLSGCASNEQPEAQKEENETIVVEENDEELEEITNDKDEYPKVETSEIGTRTTYKSNKDLNMIQESGTFIVKVTGAQVSRIETNESSKFLFDDKDEVTFVTLGVEIENTSPDTNSIYPDQGVLVTNTKEQVDSNMFLSDSVGGDYMGEVIKKGNIIFLLDSQPEEINTIKYVLSAGHDKNFNSFGEDLIFEINFE